MGESPPVPGVHDVEAHVRTSATSALAVGLVVLVVLVVLVLTLRDQTRDRV